MARTIKKGYADSKPKPFEQQSNYKHESYLRLFESMLLSPAYMDLKTRQQQLYTLCKAQYYGKSKPKNDFKEQNLFQDETYFYMNKAQVVKYGLYTKNMSKEFYGDVEELIKHGFIVLASKGGSIGKKKSIYQYSDKWKEWKK